MIARVRDVEEAIAALRREVRALQRALAGRGPLTGTPVERSYDADGATPAADGRTTR